MEILDMRFHEKWILLCILGMIFQMNPYYICQIQLVYLTLLGQNSTFRAWFIFPILTYTITSIFSVFIEVPLVLLINLFGVLLGFSVLYIYGNGDLSRAKLIHSNKSFKVGYKEYHVKESGCAVSVFYPIDKDTPDFISTTTVLRYG